MIEGIGYILLVIIVILGIYHKLQEAANIEEYNTRLKTETKETKRSNFELGVGLCVWKEIECLGLALIGRKISTVNSYFTVERIKERNTIEKPFLDVLYSQYDNDVMKSIILEHFMIFKEAMLIEIFRLVWRNSVIWRKYDIMLDSVTSWLSIDFSDGLSTYQVKKRSEYRSIFIKHFDNIVKCRGLYGAAIQSFWYTAIEKYPNAFFKNDAYDSVKNEYLLRFFRYSYYEVKHYFKMAEDLILNVYNNRYFLRAERRAVNRDIRFDLNEPLFISIMGAFYDKVEEFADNKGWLKT